MGIAALILAALVAVSVMAPPGDDDRLTVADIEFRGSISLATGFTFADTEVGGLSAITYDARRDVYLALSDDRSRKAPARFYTLAIDTSDGRLDAGDLAFVDVTFLEDAGGARFAARATDPEGIFLVGRRRLYISSEGDADAEPPIDPFVRRFRRSGRQKLALPVPDKFKPDPTGATGIRFNLAFESLTALPGGGELVTATEGALRQDGPEADLQQPSLARILRFDLDRRRPAGEHVYVVEPVAEAPDPPDAFRVNGLVELLALDRAGTFLALERSFSVGRGNTVVLYEVSTAGATDVSGLETLLPGGSAADFEPVSKRRLLSLGDVGLVPDNLEGMALGPPMADGRLPLIVVGDNNFNPDQETQFVLLAVDLVQRNAEGDSASDAHSDS